MLLLSVVQLADANKPDENCEPTVLLYVVAKSHDKMRCLKLSMRTPVRWITWIASTP